jgi:hypothetical protein
VPPGRFPRFEERGDPDGDRLGEGTEEGREEREDGSLRQEETRAEAGLGGPPANLQEIK